MYSTVTGRAGDCCDLSDPGKPGTAPATGNAAVVVIVVLRLTICQDDDDARLVVVLAAPPDDGALISSFDTLTDVLSFFTSPPNLLLEVAISTVCFGVLVVELKEGGALLLEIAPLVLLLLCCFPAKLLGSGTVSLTRGYPPPRKYDIDVDDGGNLLGCDVVVTLTMAAGNDVGLVGGGSLAKSNDAVVFGVAGVTVMAAILLTTGLVLMSGCFFNG